jgi:RNA polymerase sigma factor (sigma-70 family)
VTYDICGKAYVNQPVNLILGWTDGQARYGHKARWVDDESEKYLHSRVGTLSRSGTPGPNYYPGDYISDYMGRDYGFERLGTGESKHGARIRDTKGPRNFLARAQPTAADNAWFTDNVLPHWFQVRQTALYREMHGDQDKADELAQRVYVRAWVKGRQQCGADSDKVLPWLLNTVRFEAMSMRAEDTVKTPDNRRQGRFKSYEAVQASYEAIKDGCVGATKVNVTQVDAWTDPGFSAVDDDEEWTTLYATLPDRQRQVFELVVRQGFTQAEAAEVLSVDQATVSRAVSSLRKVLRLAFEKMHKNVYVKPQYREGETLSSG